MPHFFAWHLSCSSLQASLDYATIRTLAQLKGENVLAGKEREVVHFNFLPVNHNTVCGKSKGGDQGEKNSA